MTKLSKEELLAWFKDLYSAANTYGYGGGGDEQAYEQIKEMIEGCCGYRKSVSNDTAWLGFFFCDGIVQGLFLGDDKLFPFHVFDPFPLYEIRNWKCEIDDEFWGKEMKIASNAKDWER